MRIILIISGVILILGMVIYFPENNVPKINGASIVNPPRPISKEKMAELKRVNAGWVAVIPYGFSRAGQPKVSFDANQWWGEKTKGTCILIEHAKANGMKVMLKPHVWVMGQGWTGDYDLSSEDDWKTWEKGFSEYILNHARVADSLNVEILCIGTEYRIPAKERPTFWRALIKEVKKIYDGKITYAANWDNYQNITWWDEVDYIGIDAYFPLIEKEHPTIKEIVDAWTPMKEELKGFADQWKRPILFTEYGFLSVNGALGRHWELDKSAENSNLLLQADAYEATFQALENEDWYAGGFFWKWHLTSRSGDWYKTEWTPQWKPAEEVIAEWYGKIN